MEYHQREQQKEKAYEILQTSYDKNEIIKAIEMIGKADYHRSRQSAEVDGKTHPDLHTFMCHWLSAMIDTLIGNESAWGKANIPTVLDQLFAKYPAPKKLKIRKGYSYWNH